MIRFYICRTCGNLIEMIEDSGVVPNCCGEDMEELIPGTTDGAKEKHIPVYTEAPGKTESCERWITVNVGEKLHPMEKGHFISWILIWTNEGIYRKDISHCDKASADFCLKTDERIKAIYSYCNLHGLWINTP